MRTTHLLCAAIAALTSTAMIACRLGSVDLGSDTGGGDGGPAGDAAPSLGDPPGIDLQKTVAELTDAEAEAWCTWFVTEAFVTFEWAVPPDAPVHPDGTVTSYEALACPVPPYYCVSRLSINHCMANLRLDGCTAMVSQLDACVLAAVAHCEVPGDACGVYAAHPNCSRTIITTVDQDECTIPVQ